MTPVTPPADKRNLTWPVKLGIGAVGGVCLALVKLVEVNFYIGESGPKAIGGFLTLLAFVLLAALSSVFLGEKEPKKVFLQGLLAPSLLIALIHQGAGLPAQTPSASPSAIPSFGIMELLIPGVHAEELLQEMQAKALDVPVERIRGTATDGALLALGRGSASASFMYVIGKGTDARQASAVADRVQRALLTSGSGLRVQTIRIEGRNELYVTVGGLLTGPEAARTRADVVKKVVDSGQVDAATLKMLVNGPVVDGRELLK
jgi:hypothetical protein